MQIVVCFRWITFLLVPVLQSRLIDSELTMIIDGALVKICG